MARTVARDLVRTVVLTTNSWWPFSRCNHWPYGVAMRSFVRSLRKTPEVRSIYLRRDLEQRPFIPGSSDIDLTLVLESNLGVDREYELLSRFWKAHARLKRIFPMLGEVEILDAGEMPAWLTWTISDPHGPSWTLLGGEPNPHVSAIRSPHWRRRALVTALAYVIQLPACLARPDSALRRHDILRRVRKVLGLLEPILKEAGQPRPAIAADSADAAVVVACALKALEVAIGCVQNAGQRQDRSIDLRDRVTTISRGEPRQTLHVIDDGLDLETIAGHLRATWTSGHGGSSPLVLTRRLLALLVRDLDPHLYGRLTLQGALDIPPPGREEFAAHAVDRLFHLPLFVRGEELFLQPLAVASIGNQLNSVVAAMGFLRDTTVASYSNTRDDRWRQECPDYVIPFDEMQALARDGHLSAAHQAAFRLVRSILKGAGDLMNRDVAQQSAPAVPRA